jgi:hypothetical protein
MTMPSRIAALAVTALVAVSTQASAQTASATASAAPSGNAHPHYMEALTDLRLARALLLVEDKSAAGKFSFTAAGDIGQAMAEIKHASIDDGKSEDDHAPIDANVSRRDRLHEALSLVEGAERDLKAEEDDQKALGWRARAQKDVADAHAFVLASINNEGKK